MRKIALKKGLSLSEYGFKDLKDNSKNIIDVLKMAKKKKNF